MFLKKSTPVMAIFALIATLFTVMPDQPASAAVNSASMDSSPTDGATVSIDDVINVKNNLTLPDNSTVDATMSQTWGAGRAAFVAAVVPSGWGLEYQTAGSAWGALPADLKTVSGVRASITGLTTGASHTTNGATALVRKPSQLVVSDSATVAASGRGDGWDVFFSPKYILNVYHHDADYKLECHTRATGELCNSTLYKVTGAATSNGSGGNYYGGRVYSFVKSGTSAAVICTEVGAQPFLPCGITTFSSGAISSATSHLSSQTFDGTNIWAVDIPNKKLLCYNVRTESVCASAVTSLGAGFDSSGKSIPAFVTYVGSQIFIGANKIYCYKTDATVCDGTWPVNYSSGAANMNLVPYLTTGGTVTGVCSIKGALQCTSTAGATIAFPSGLSTILGAVSTEVSGGSGYFEAKAWWGTRLYWTVNPSGTDWSTAQPYCYDFATDAMCLNWDKTAQLGTSRYALTTDPTNPGCIWTNGDNGAISNFDGTTGKIGCPVTTVRGIVNFDAIPNSACSLVSPLATGFGFAKFSVPGGYDVTALRVTIRDGSGNDVAGWVDVAPAADGTIDLSTLASSQTSSSFSFVFSGAGLTKPQAAGIDTELNYTVDMLQPYQLCVVVKVLPTCTFATGAITSPQDSITFSAATSFTVSGTTTEETASRTFNVNNATLAQCTAPNYGDTGGGGGGTTTSPAPVKRGPVVTHIDKRDWATNTGGKVVITGDNWIAVQKLVIDGKPVNIVKSSEGEMTIDLPPSPTGVYSFVLYTDNGVLTFDNAFTFTPKAAPAQGGARPPVTITIGNFIDGSPVITKAIAAKIKAFMAKYNDYRTIECIGYTEGPTVLKTDKALSLKRATNACGYVRNNLKKVMVQLPLKSGQDTIEQSQRRRITITLRD